ncbi:MAG TPA: GGDEF domain-containing protein [Acidimicrobiales bacterium]|nr:GGDEF domain-containing protein [Acidimicrobiales bacterium]
MPEGASRRARVDAPVDGEWAAWWGAPVRLRLLTVVVAGAALAVCAGAGRGALPGDWKARLAAVVIAGLASVELGRLAEGGRIERQRLHKGLSTWPFAAALLLGPAPAGWVAAAVYGHAWVRGIRIRRWKWIGSWAIVVLAGLGASTAMRAATGALLPPTGSTSTMLGVVAALVVFLAVETVLFFGFSRVNTAEDEVHLRAALAGRGFYLLEAAVLTSGAIAAVVCRYSPAFLVFAGPAYALVQRGLLHQSLRDEARHDAKTGVLHSEAWRAGAPAVFAQAERAGRKVAVAIVDLDCFKAVNDTHGHLVGDEVLAGAADAVVGSLRRDDLAGRFGGDEFCALMVCDSLDEAAAVGDRIRCNIAGLRFACPELEATASVGVAVAHPADVGDVARLVEVADQALYDAKTAGRNLVRSRVVVPARRRPGGRASIGG